MRIGDSMRDINLNDLKLGPVKAQDVLAFAKDATYIAVGFGILTFQKAQVCRREAMSKLQDQIAKQF
jgi:hypothetical protein